MERLEIFYDDYKKIFEWALYLNRQKKYRLKTISKKGGGKRKLRIPPSATDTVQKKLNKILQQLYTPPKPIHGFVKAEESFIKNIVTNAQQHIKKNIVINVDIIDFFDNINFGRVRGLFLAKPFNLNPKLATKIAQLTTYDNKLPQGASTSPIISNIICKKMDHELIKFAKKHSLTFTRYADDITFSSNKTNLKIEQILEQLEIIINNNGFDINPDKTRVL
jgi:RNA-directed DNA polymerase